MRRRARAAGLEGARGRVRDVALVVDRVQVLAVPAAGEVQRHAPAAAAGLLGECLGVGSRARRAAEGVLLHVGLAAVAELLLHGGCLAVQTVTDKHTEALVILRSKVSFLSLSSFRHPKEIRVWTYRLEGRDLGAGLVASDVVDSHTCLDAESQVGDLRNALEGPVAGLVIEVRRPVVAEILAVCAAGARRDLGRVVAVGRHAGVERVSTDDLVHVGGWHIARLDQGVNLVDDELRATEAHQLLRCGKLHRQRGHESLQQHFCCCCCWRSGTSVISTMGRDLFPSSTNGLKTATKRKPGDGKRKEETRKH